MSLRRGTSRRGAGAVAGHARRPVAVAVAQGVALLRNLAAGSVLARLTKRVSNCCAGVHKNCVCSASVNGRREWTLAPTFY
ncbi:MAG: hypothetical protein MHM6MM_005358 [Cercozoa sp. M6MM]